jgi:hypothetical protein
MNYELTEHARSALAKRQIVLDWLERTLFAAEWVEIDVIDSRLEHRLARIEAYGNRVLHVIINIDSVPPRVVTAYFDRRRSNR